MTAADYDRIRRRCLTAATYFRRSAGGLHALHEAEKRAEVRWLLGYDSCRLLVSTLGEAELLAACLENDDQVGEALEAARVLVARLEARSKVTRRARLAAKLSNTAGRSPAEASAFAEKAAAFLAGPS